MDITSYIKSKLDEFRNTVTTGYNKVADALPLVPNTSQIQSFVSSPVQYMTNPKYNSGNNIYSTSPFQVSGAVQLSGMSAARSIGQGINQYDQTLTRLSQNPNPVVNTMPKAILSAGNANIKYNQAVQSNPVTFSQQGLRNYIDQQKLKLDAVVKTASPVLDVALAPTVGLAEYAGMAGVGGLFGAGSQMVDNALNKRGLLNNVGNAISYGAQQGLMQAPKISTITSITNPAIAQTAGKVLSKFPELGSIGQNIFNRVLQGSLSVPQGMAIAKATGQDYGPINAALDFAMGSGLAKKAGKMAIDGPYGNGESGMVGNSKSIHPEDYKLYDSANTVVHERGKFSPAEISKATNDLRVLGEKYLPVSDQPSNGNPVLLANRLTARMARNVLATPGNVGSVDLNAKVDTGIFKSPYERGDIGKIQAELENMLGVPPDAGFKQKQATLGQNYAILQQAADAGAPGAPEAVARAKELFSAIELAQKGKTAAVDLKLNEPVTTQIDRTQLTGRQLSATNAKLQRAYPKGNIEEQFPVSNGASITEKDANKQIDMISEAITKKYRARNVGLDELDMLAQTPDSQLTGRIPVSKPTPDEADFIKSLEQDSRGVFVKSDAKGRVGMLDYFRTPENVLKKIGLEPESNKLRQAWDGYKSDLKTEISKISEWQKRVPDPQSSKAIFDYLDGQKVELAPNEKKVAEEIRSYLADWAVKLNLPKDKQVSSYITHLFDNDIAAKAQPPELAGIVMDQVPGSVYNPFLAQRLGAQGYVRDTWRALDAYAKRATRKYNMDPALDSLKGASEMLDQSSYNYVKNYASRINMRPTDIDSLIDNTFKNLPFVGNMFGSRPVTTVTQRARQWAYRAALGFNPSSALRNLTQVSNTYSKLGEKYTASGYFRMMKELSTNGLQELKDVGVLDDAFITDRKFNAVKSLWERFDSAAFSMFDLAEKINRGGAYYGAKAKALAQGMNEQNAIDFAKKVVRDTQFQFGSIDTPLALSSDLAKTAGQFMSYPIKQTEFLAGMLKKKDFLGVARYVGATTVLMGTVGKLWGMKATDAIPFAENVKGLMSGGEQGQLPNPPIASYAQGLAALPNALNATDDGVREDAKKKVGNAVKLLIPGGVAASRAIQGFKALQKGYSESSTGKKQYDVQSDPVSAARTLIFGKNTLPQAQDYYSKMNTYFGTRDQVMSTLNDQEKKAFDSLPKYDVNNPSSYDKEDSRLRYAIFANNPRVFEAKKAIELASAKQNGTPLDPIYLLSGDEARAVFTFYQASPGSQERRDLKTQYPIINSFLDARTKYFNDKDMQAIQDQFSKGQITKDQAAAATQALNDKIASYSSGSKKPKKIASSKARKVKAVKVKFGKFKSFKFPKVAKLKKYKVKKLTARA